MSNNHERLDPELAQALAAIPKGPQGVFDLTDIPATRIAVRAFAESIAAQSPDDPSVTVEEYIALGANHPDVSLRLLRPRSLDATPQPALLWFHGGGQVLGYAAQDDAYLKPLCATVGCITIAVDYRLAPEAPAPAAAQDGALAYRWVLEHAEELGIDPHRLGIAGASGGGGIAAATAQIIRDQGLPAPLFQSLIYPMLDDRNETPSSTQVTDLGIWDRHANLLAWQAILPEGVGSETLPSYAVAARAESLDGLPPAFIAVGELDLFRDEDLDYSRRLLEAGTAVELHLYPGAFHAFDLFAPTAAVSRAFTEAWFGYLARRFNLTLSQS